MRPASNKTVPAKLEVTGPARLDLTQSVVHPQKGVGPGEHSGNPSAQHPITVSPFNQHNQKHSNLREREEADLRYQNCNEVSKNAISLGKELRALGRRRNFKSSSIKSGTCNYDRELAIQIVP
jgi:hypothetical protein